MIYQNIIDKINKRKKLFSILIDPDKQTENSLEKMFRLLSETEIDFILVGSSILYSSIDKTLALIKKNVPSCPVLLFPGSTIQVSDKADGILLLSLISGRNPEFLIGQHVVAAPFLRNCKFEIIPTGYILIESGQQTSVEYMSNTKPIPSDKIEIAVATAMAGEMLGAKFIYMDAGSGAPKKIKPELVSEVKKNINIPLIIGGGIRNKSDIEESYRAGADIIIIGTALEQNINLIKEFVTVTKMF